jgi:hypothetical protein
MHRENNWKAVILYDCSASLPLRYDKTGDSALPKHAHPGLAANLHMDYHSVAQLVPNNTKASPIAKFNKDFARIQFILDTALCWVTAPVVAISKRGQ